MNTIPNEKFTEVIKERKKTKILTKTIFKTDNIRSKKANENNFPEYYQVFGTKFPFAPDLSVLDLIFNEGPEAAAYFTSISNPDQSLFSVSRS